MQYLAAIIQSLSSFRPHQMLLVAGVLLVALSGIAGIAGVVVVDDMRRFVGYAGVGMVILAIILAVVRAYFEAKGQPPVCNLDCRDDDEPAGR